MIHDPISCCCKQCGKDFVLPSWKVRHGQGIYCSNGCYGLARSGSFADVFWRHVPQRPEVGCWEWAGTVLWTGYGQLMHRRKHYLAHRVSWTIAHGEIPADLLVLHHCDNRRCVRPLHLFLGTYADNSADAVRKRRNAFGERVNTAKLTELEVREIRLRLAAGESQRDLRDVFNISQAQMSKIALYQSWRHVTIGHDGASAQDYLSNLNRAQMPPRRSNTDGEVSCTAEGLFDDAQ